MLTTIEGVYHDGKIELLEVPPRGIDRVHAADLRARLAAFAEDWDSPEMEVYDHYDAAKSPV